MMYIQNDFSWENSCESRVLFMSKNLDYVYIKMDFFVKNIKLCKGKKYFPAEILFSQRQKEEGESSIR